MKCYLCGSNVAFDREISLKFEDLDYLFCSAKCLQKMSLRLKEGTVQQKTGWKYLDRLETTWTRGLDALRFSLLVLSGMILGLVAGSLTPGWTVPGMTPESMATFWVIAGFTFGLPSAYIIVGLLSAPFTILCEDCRRAGHRVPNQKGLEPYCDFHYWFRFRRNPTVPFAKDLTWTEYRRERMERGLRLFIPPNDQSVSFSLLLE